MHRWYQTHAFRRAGSVIDARIPSPLCCRRVEGAWYWLGITWGFYIMEPWETAIVLTCVLGCLAAALHGLWLLAGWLRAAGVLRTWG